MLLGMLGLAIVWLVNLPFRIVGHWWALRYDVSDAGYLDLARRGLDAARRPVRLASASLS